MTRDRSRRDAPPGASPAELDGLGTVIAAAAAMADRAGSATAGDLLRRALTLVRERSGPPAEGAGRDRFRTP